MVIHVLSPLKDQRDFGSSLIAWLFQDLRTDTQITNQKLNQKLPLTINKSFTGVKLKRSQSCALSADGSTQKDHFFIKPRNQTERASALWLTNILAIAKTLKAKREMARAISDKDSMQYNH